MDGKVAASHPSIHTMAGGEMTAFFLQLLVYVMVEEEEEMNEGLEGWMVGWQVGITWRNDRCLPTAAHCPYTSCITHIDYLPFSTLRVDSSFK